MVEVWYIITISTFLLIDLTHAPIFTYYLLQMYRCDDEIVTPVSEDDVSNLEGYVYLMPFIAIPTLFFFFVALTSLLLLPLIAVGTSSSMFDGMRDDSHLVLTEAPATKLQNIWMHSIVYHVW